MAEKETTQKRPPKSPVLAGFLGLIPGVGAIYNGQILKGIVFIFIYAGLISMQQHGSIQPLAAFALTGFIIYLVIDAVQTANRLNRIALAGGEVEEEKMEEKQLKKNKLLLKDKMYHLMTEYGKSLK